jgi:hypothetical protein
MTSLQDARRMALALPEAVEAPHHEMSSFRVRGKIFATVPADGRHLHVFVDESVREPLVAAMPQTYEVLRWGARVVGVRVDLGRAHAGTVADLLRSAWGRKAPQSLRHRYAAPIDRPSPSPS